MSSNGHGWLYETCVGAYRPHAQAHCRNGNNVQSWCRFVLRAPGDGHGRTGKATRRTGTRRPRWRFWGVGGCTTVLLSLIWLSNNLLSTYYFWTVCTVENAVMSTTRSLSLTNFKSPEGNRHKWIFILRHCRRSHNNRYKASQETKRRKGLGEVGAVS